MKEMQGSGDYATATLNTRGLIAEALGLEGRYHVICRDSNGMIKWEEDFPNQVVQAGKILMMNNTLFSQTAIVGPYLGLVSGTGNTFSPTDTMATHAGWTEFTAYTTTGANRGTATFVTATGNAVTTPGSNIVTSTAGAVTYTITAPGGTVGGCFLVTGTGAVATISSTLGTLWSAGAFGTAKVTTAGDTVAVTYSSTATS